MTEQVLWAIPKGKTDALFEEIITSTTCKAHFDKARKWALEQGFHSLRIQQIDGSLPDFVGAIQ